MTSDDGYTQEIAQLEQRLRERFAQVMNEPEIMWQAQDPAQLKLAAWTALVNATAEMTALLQERHGVDSVLDDTTEKLCNVHASAVEVMRETPQPNAPGSHEVN